MHRFLKYLSARQSSLWTRYGTVGLLIGSVTILRLVFSLDTAPFLLYLPLVFLLSVAFGMGPGLVALVLSAILATSFFVTPERGWTLTAPQIVALTEYVLVGVAMVLVCDALRAVLRENEVNLSRLQEANSSLIASRETLAAAKVEAESAKDAAEAANRAKSAFLANMSHELRTPLSAVIGYSEMLEEDADDAGQTGMLTDIGKVKANARHLLSLINDVLDLSKIEANRMDTFADDVVVASLAQEVAATGEALAKTKANTLVLDIVDGLGSMHTDVVKLRQCLFNLISNACKFTENGRVELRVRRETTKSGDWLSFAVNDTGIGMTPDQVQRLFQRFTQADETTTRRFGGTGLGLALSRAFSRLLGGDITVESTEGRGTCFTVRVPAIMPGRKLEDDTASSNIAVPAPEGHRELVLVIDDEASQRELMTRFLERQRFEVKTASDGRAGLEMARELKPRAILLDVMMPQMDGWSVLTALKADPDLAKIPVVMVTFVAETGLGEALGAADHVAKPIDWHKLKSVMDPFRDAEGDVLVVDDDPDARHRLRTVLEKNGWSVQEAANGAEALKHVLHAPPHLILLDLTMPVMDGFAFLHRLRETPGCADIPVVVLSARDITSAERKQLSEADRILKKGETSMRELAIEIRAIENKQQAGTEAS